MEKFDLGRLQALNSRLENLPQGGLEKGLIDTLFEYCVKKDGLVFWELESQYCYNLSDVAIRTLIKLSDRDSNFQSKAKSYLQSQVQLHSKLHSQSDSIAQTPMEPFSDSEKFFTGNPLRRGLNSQSYPRSPTETSSDEEEPPFGRPFRPDLKDGLSGIALNGLLSGASLKRPHEDSDGPPSKRQHLTQGDNPLLKLSRNPFTGAPLKRPNEDSDGLLSNGPPSKRQHLIQGDNPLSKLSRNPFTGASLKRPNEDSDDLSPDGPPSKRQHLLSPGN
ncbi:hypothetical protein BDV09DRAFT_201542 [Aspergillus tetrazonus]